MEQAFQQALEWIDELFEELRLPGVKRGVFMHHPSLVHRGKSIIGSKDGRSIVVHCPLDLKDILLDAEPETYFQTDHYRGNPAILIRPETIDRERLRARIVAAWQMNATLAQLRERDVATGTAERVDTPDQRHRPTPE